MSSVRLRTIMHSLLDAPTGSTMIVFFPQCNLRCDYCYNIDLVFNQDSDVASSLDDVKQKFNLLHRQTKNGLVSIVDWITFSGGECTLWHDELTELLIATKEHNLKTCVYTNAQTEKCDEFLISLYEQQLLDAVYIDYKETNMPDVWESTVRKLLATDLIIRFNTTLTHSRATKENIWRLSTYLNNITQSLNNPILRSDARSTMNRCWTLTGAVVAAPGSTIGNLPRSEAITDFELRKLLET